MSGQAREAAALRLDKVARSYRQGGARLEVFRDASLAVRPGEIVGLVGPSGSGKSTLLHIAGLLDTPDTGEVAIAGRSMAGASDAARTAARRRDIGFVYQFHHLLPEFTARENVAIAQLVAGAAAPRARARAEELLTALGLGQRLGHRPGELSGGEQQRVAIARAIANRPLLLLGDEPTGNLDPPTADRVFAALLDLARAEGLAALIATHNLDLAGRMDRVLRLEDGHIVEAGAR